MLRESVIEQRLVDRVRARGGQAYKFKSPNRANVPDRIVLLPGGCILFAEVKSPGEKPTEAQLREHIRLRKLGFEVVVVDSLQGIDERWPA